jgi:hypothetical protein
MCTDPGTILDSGSEEILSPTLSPTWVGLWSGLKRPGFWVGSHKIRAGGGGESGKRAISSLRFL